MPTWRTLQPPHQSEKFTLEEAMQAIEEVEAEMAAERARKRRSRSRRSAPVVTRPSSGRGKLAADRADRPAGPGQEAG